MVAHYFLVVGAKLVDVKSLHKQLKEMFLKDFCIFYLFHT